MRPDDSNDRGNPHLTKQKTANKDIFSYLQKSRNATKQNLYTEDDSRGTDSSFSCKFFLRFSSFWGEHDFFVCLQLDKFLMKRDFIMVIGLGAGGSTSRIKNEVSRKVAFESFNPKKALLNDNKEIDFLGKLPLLNLFTNLFFV